MLTAKQLGAELGITKNTIIKLANQGKIPFLRLPTERGDLRFDLEEVKKVMRRSAENHVQSHEQ